MAIRFTGVSDLGEETLGVGVGGDDSSFPSNVLLTVSVRMKMHEIVEW
ncbi:MAG: hypothetical protein ACN4GG_09425 [Akkermansiaceae bacterium]